MTPKTSRRTGVSRDEAIAIVEQHLRESRTSVQLHIERVLQTRRSWLILAVPPPGEYLVGGGPFAVRKKDGALDIVRAAILEFREQPLDTFDRIARQWHRLFTY